MRRILWFLLSLAPVSTAFADENAELATEAKRILSTHCYRCHGQNGANEGGMAFVLDFPTLVAKKKVVPGDPGQSRIYKRMHPDLIGDMPMDELTTPSTADIAAIEAWIKAGAPNTPPETVEPRPFVSVRDELAAMQRYLRKASRDDRPLTRFFTIRHLHNLPRAQVRDTDLRVYQAALSKLVNSLSRTKEIVVPEPVDEAGTLYAVNLLRLDWDRGALWNEILKVYPYGLQHEEYPDEQETRDLAEEVYFLAGTKVPAVRADWFVTTAARPPLYHTLLQLPINARDLERDLGVDVIENFRTGRLRRGGFNASGVSNHNRLVERHATDVGAYWKSYDFKLGAGRGNLFVFPLGPEFPDHPFPRNTFRHAGGEIIFNLPNGLQGYLLVDSQDQRIDEGPIDIVSDGKKVSGTPAVVNGLSCMACHQHGMIPFTDQIRNGHILGGDARELVKRLYPEQAEMDKLLERDRKRFLIALDEATGPFLKVGDDAGRTIDEFPEPITAIARW